MQITFSTKQARIVHCQMKLIQRKCPQVIGRYGVLSRSPSVMQYPLQIFDWVDNIRMFISMNITLSGNTEIHNSFQTFLLLMDGKNKNICVVDWGRNRPQTFNIGIAILQVILLESEMTETDEDEDLVHEDGQHNNHKIKHRILSDTSVCIRFINNTLTSQLTFVLNVQFFKFGFGAISWPRCFCIL